MNQAAPVRLRTRQRYSKEFKNSVITEALQPHVSIAAVALSHGLNANLLRRWIQESTPSYVGKNQTRLLSASDSSSTQDVPGFLPVTVPAAFSRSNWTPSPRQTGRLVQSKLDTRSTANWTSIPGQTGHP